MKKLIACSVVLLALTAGALDALAETDYTVAREVFLLKARVGALEAAKAAGATTNIVSTNRAVLSFDDGYLTSVSPY